MYLANSFLDPTSKAHIITVISFLEIAFEGELPFG